MKGKAIVAIVMGSKSDLSNLKNAFELLDEFGISYTARILSAHRTPMEAVSFAEQAEKNGLKVMICAAGMAAHLAGVMAANTIIPVIGIPMSSEPFNGLDSLLSMVQMPPGIPVATVTVGKCGGVNAVLLAASILALSDARLAGQLKDFRVRQARSVLDADNELRK